MEVKEEQYLNASSLNAVTPFGMVIVVNEKQKENALPPIDVTLFGMVMDVKEEQERKAACPIVVIPSLNIIFSICPLIEDQGAVDAFWELSNL